MTSMSDAPRKASLVQGVKMVLSAFVGIKRRGDSDRIEITPVQVIVTGVIAAAIFVFTVITVVRVVTA